MPSEASEIIEDLIRRRSEMRRKHGFLAAPCTVWIGWKDSEVLSGWLADRNMRQDPPRLASMYTTGDPTVQQGEAVLCMCVRVLPGWVHESGRQCLHANEEWAALTEAVELGLPLGPESVQEKAAAVARYLGQAARVKAAIGVPYEYEQAYAEVAKEAQRDGNERGSASEKVNAQVTAPETTRDPGEAADAGRLRERVEALEKRLADTPTE